MEPLRPGDPHEVGSYRLLGRLGGGGMGEVFLGRSPGGRPVAVKLVLPGVDTAFRRRFAQEVDAARCVGGFHTAQVVDADPHANPPWMVTAYVQGPSLEAAVKAHGGLPLATVQTLAAGLAEGLAAIHDCGLVHRDLKPANVILASDGPRIIDFGIAFAKDVSRVTAAGAVIGSPGFMSPEQANGAEPGPSSDVFALGSVLAFAATGRGPFDEQSVAATIYRITNSPPKLDKVPDELRGVIEACLAKDPAERPSVRDLLTHFSAMTGTTENWLPPEVAAMITTAKSPDQSPPPPPAKLESPEYLPPTPGDYVPPPAYPAPPAYGPVGYPPTQPATAPQDGGWSPYTQQPPNWNQRSGNKALLVAAGTMAFLVLIAVAGFLLYSLSQDDAENSPPAARPPESAPQTPPDASPTSASPNAQSVAGTWSGTYTCAQGKTALRLTIEEASAQGDLTGTFTFFADTSNPTVPSGSFAMKGTLRDGALQLRGDHWINRPEDYLMVNLRANVIGRRPTRIQGTVEGASCTDFDIKRS
jgi:serine/threonine protein kinase